MTHLLVTLKGEQYEQSHHAYGVLAEIDWPAKRVVRSLKIPSASFRHEEAFMAPLVGGVCCRGKRIFMAFWNFVLEIDYDTFNIVNAVSSPWMADLHGLACDERHLYVTSTAVTSLLALDLNDLSPCWQWGPKEELLLRGGSWWSRWRAGQASLAGDYRHRHKSRSPHYRHHLNDVRYHQGHLYLTTLKWWDKVGGAVIRLNPDDRQADFFLPPGSLFGPHDGVVSGEDWLFTESARNGVVWAKADGSLQRHPLTPTPAFVRGLCALENSFLVGFTRLRQHPTPSWIVEFDAGFKREISRMDVSDFYPASIGAAIHALALAPGS